jgi:hypothetical protein
MIDARHVLEHKNLRFLIINIINNSAAWLIDALCLLGHNANRESMSTSVAEYIKSIYLTKLRYDLTQKSYSEFLLSDSDMPYLAAVYLLNGLSSENVFNGLIVMYIALESNEVDFDYFRQKHRDMGISDVYFFYILEKMSEGDRFEQIHF